MSLSVMARRGVGAIGGMVPAVVLGSLLVLVGCGDAEEPSGGDDPTTGGSPADKGPECVGDEASTASGTRVLRGGEATLPGGGTVSYEEAEADGTTRRAGLSQDGGGGSELLGLGEQLTVQGNAYSVSQICTYRVVLASDDPELTPDPVPEPDWPDTQDGSWTLNGGISVDRPESSLNVYLSSTSDDDLGIVVRNDAVVVASYDDVAVGQTVEIADQLWEVAETDAGNGEMADDHYEPASVRLELLGLAVS